jgi:predicted NBD/HSP70 family sugar kinase
VRGGSMLDKGDNRAIREVNRSLVLDLVRGSERISRTELARRSRLTKPTVSAIVDELVSDGVVREVGFGASVAGGGRPARLLEFNDDSAAYLGIHFGSRLTSVALADARGAIRHVRGRPALHGSAARSLKVVRAMVAEVLQMAKVPRSRIEGAGVSAPGLVDQESGVCVLAPNLGWRDFPLRAALVEELGVPVVVHNVTHAAAVAEGRVGAARGARSYVWVWVGRGIGAGAVMDGRLFLGQRGFSGDIGHCPVRDDGPLCGCGRRGCLETLASTAAIARAAEAAVAAGEPTSLRGAAGSIRAAAVAEAATAGDEVARRILAEAGEHLGRGISYLLNILNPELVVLGGPLAAAAGPALFDPVRASVARHALVPQGIAVIPSSLSDRADLVGAVLLAMDHTVRTYRIVAAPAVSGGTRASSGSWRNGPA